MTHERFFLVALLFLTGCPGEVEDSDGGGGIDAGPGTDAGPVVLYDPCEDTMPGVTALAPVASSLIGAIVPSTARVATAPGFNPASEGGEFEYRAMNFDDYTRGAGIDRVVRDDLGGSGPGLGADRRSIAYFVHLADTQLADDESPTRLAMVDTPPVPGGLRAQEAYLPRAMSAMNRTLARIERAERPYDFGVITGDCADSAQFNEMVWFMDVMNGAAGVHTDSGDDDDLIAGPNNDPKDPFDAIAFPAPWLYVPGNHDVEVVGIGRPSASNMAAALGTMPSTGTRDYRRRWGAVTTREVPADPDRRIVERDEIVAAMLADVDGPGPVGHGYTAGVDLTDGANYVYDAIPNLLRIITIDTNDEGGGSEGLVLRATVDNFLLPALAQAAIDGVLVILASHHATTSIDTLDGQIGDPVADAVPPAELESIAAGSANVIAWVVGHSHNNRIRAIEGPDAAHPGYWEIMAPAIADYPSQSRIIEIVANGNDTLSIFTTLVDFDEDSCEERRFRRLTIMEYTSAWTDDISTDPLDLNVELLVPVSDAEMTTRIAAAALTGSTRLESETTLRGTP